MQNIPDSNQIGAVNPALGIQRQGSSVSNQNGGSGSSVAGGDNVEQRPISPFSRRVIKMVEPREEDLTNFLEKTRKESLRLLQVISRKGLNSKAKKMIALLEDKLSVDIFYSSPNLKSRAVIIRDVFDSAKVLLKIMSLKKFRGGTVKKLKAFLTKQTQFKTLHQHYREYKLELFEQKIKDEPEYKEFSATLLEKRKKAFRILSSYNRQELEKLPKSTISKLAQIKINLKVADFKKLPLFRQQQHIQAVFDDISLIGDTVDLNKIVEVKSFEDSHIEFQNKAEAYDSLRKKTVKDYIKVQKEAMKKDLNRAEKQKYLIASTNFEGLMNNLRDEVYPLLKFFDVNFRKIESFDKVLKRIEKEISPGEFGKLPAYKYNDLDKVYYMRYTFKILSLLVKSANLTKEQRRKLDQFLKKAELFKSFAKKFVHYHTRVKKMGNTEQNEMQPVREVQVDVDGINPDLETETVGVDLFAETVVDLEVNLEIKRTAKEQYLSSFYFLPVRKLKLSKENKQINDVIGRYNKAQEELLVAVRNISKSPTHTNVKKMVERFDAVAELSDVLKLEQLPESFADIFRQNTRLTNKLLLFIRRYHNSVLNPKDGERSNAMRFFSEAQNLPSSVVMFPSKKTKSKKNEKMRQFNEKAASFSRNLTKLKTRFLAEHAFDALDDLNDMKMIALELETGFKLSKSERKLLRANIQKLNKMGGFGFHLIKVSEDNVEQVQTVLKKLNKRFGIILKMKKKRFSKESKELMTKSLKNYESLLNGFTESSRNSIVTLMEDNSSVLFPDYLEQERFLDVEDGRFKFDERFKKIGSSMHEDSSNCLNTVVFFRDLTQVLMTKKDEFLKELADQFGGAKRIPKEVKDYLEKIYIFGPKVQKTFGSLAKSTLIGAVFAEISRLKFDRLFDDLTKGVAITSENFESKYLEQFVESQVQGEALVVRSIDPFKANCKTYRMEKDFSKDMLLFIEGLMSKVKDTTTKQEFKKLVNVQIQELLAKYQQQRFNMESSQFENLSKLMIEAVQLNKERRALWKIKNKKGKKYSDCLMDAYIKFFTGQRLKERADKHFPYHVHTKFSRLAKSKKEMLEKVCEFDPEYQSLKNDYDDAKKMIDSKKTLGENPKQLTEYDLRVCAETEREMRESIRKRFAELTSDPKLLLLHSQSLFDVISVDVNFREIVYGFKKIELA